MTGAARQRVLAVTTATSVICGCSKIQDGSTFWYCLPTLSQSFWKLAVLCVNDIKSLMQLN